jgi:hypothetical protein
MIAWQKDVMKLETKDDGPSRTNTDLRVGDASTSILPFGEDMLSVKIFGRQIDWDAAGMLS